ncbi:hypothetical protein GWN49_06725 [Candidatus Bathyarchaeota archaeon]|nr:hypothetical protein [Candidatus Bathyarchaeota archaeon]
MKVDSEFIIDIKCLGQRQTAMFNPKSKDQRRHVRRTEADKRIAEIRTRIEKLLESTKRIEGKLALKEKELQG